MKLALIGKSISHSRSPAIYKQLLSGNVEYDLLDIKEVSALPEVSKLAHQYDGVNITSPYKAHYVDQVVIQDKTVKKLGAINTISLIDRVAYGTNTDLLAVRSILASFCSRFTDLHIILLGSGVMARLTKLVVEELGISLTQLSRKEVTGLSDLNLSLFEKPEMQNLVINACSREFHFQGKQSKQNIFWDYNYHFLPHQNTLPFFVKEYHDGQEMLIKQAVAAIEFFQATNPKLKC